MQKKILNCTRYCINIWYYTLNVILTLKKERFKKLTTTNQQNPYGRAKVCVMQIY